LQLPRRCHLRDDAAPSADGAPTIVREDDASRRGGGAGRTDRPAAAGVVSITDGGLRPSWLASLLQQARAVWRYRDLIRVLVVRNIKVKYQRSALGLLWTLLNPLLMLLILMAVFTHIVRIPIPDYWAFLLSGYFVFNCVSQIMAVSALVYLEHATMVRSIAFPVEAPVVAAALSRFLEFLIELGFTLVLIMLFRHGGVPLSFLLVPWMVLLLLLLALGLAMPVAALSVFYYDIRNMLPVLLAALFYISPIFYSVDMVPDLLRPIFYLNPIAYLLNIFHTVLYDGTLPSFLVLATGTAMMTATFLVGYALFNRYKHLFAEVV
jgi:lipopolysaccharide transport system permease protein